MCYGFFHYQKTANKQFQSVVTARLPTHQQRPNGHTTVRIPSQSCTREWNYVDQSNSPKVISTESTDKNKTPNQNEVVCLQRFYLNDSIYKFFYIE